MNVAIMNLTYFLLLIVNLTNVSCLKRSKSLPQGCSLLPTTAVMTQMEPTEEPLSLSVAIKVLGVRDVPDRGGSYGVDVEYVQYQKLNTGQYL